LQKEPLETAYLEIAVRHKDNERDDEHECAMEDVAEHDPELHGEGNAIE